METIQCKTLDTPSSTFLLSNYSLLPSGEKETIISCYDFIDEISISLFHHIGICDK